MATTYDWEKIVNGISDASQKASTIAGNLAYTAGAAYQGWQDGKAGDTGNGHRPINDIQVDVETGESTGKAVKWLVAGAVVVAGIYLVSKFIKKNK